MEHLKALFENEGITEFAVIDFQKLSIINQRLIKTEEEIQSAIVMLIPYRHNGVELVDNYNVGLFARCMDYHLYARSLFERIIPQLKAIYGGEIFGFADHSPIDEKAAAKDAGLGFIGKNGLLINPKYGSYVFIAELLFTSKLTERLFENKYNCGICHACIAACPSGALNGSSFVREKCLSSISQKKKKTDAEREALNKTATVWGCDICQNVCPYNKKAEYSKIEYFKNSFISSFTLENVCSMDDSTYNRYAFSYRPKAVLTENFLTVNSKCDII